MYLKENNDKRQPNMCYKYHVTVKSKVYCFTLLLKWYRNYVMHTK